MNELASASGATPPRLRDILVGLSRRIPPMDFVEWLPVALLGNETPEQLASAFDGMGLDDQFALIDRLRFPDAGPFADASLLALAGQSHLISDEQARDYLLSDAVGGWQRTADRIEHLRGQLATLTGDAQAHRERLAEGFDLATERTRLEGELAGLRAREIDRNDQFSAIHQLESDILRLETRRRILERYDSVSRTEYRDQLKAEAAGLDRRRSEVESSVAAAIAARDTRRREVEGLEAELATLEPESIELAVRVAAAQSRVSSVKTDLLQAQQDCARSSDEQSCIQRELQEVEEKSRRQRDLVAAERRRLQDLQDGARALGLTDLERQILDIYQKLPDDRIDPSFRQRGGQR